MVLLGEDVTQGGVFNVTPGLAERFGERRIVDTPISELAFTSAAFGAAVRGLRPVVEIMFGDFLGLVVDTLTNQASKYWYLSNEQASVPLVVRSAVGAGASFGACHSQTPAGWFMGEPGLKLVAPSNPADAYALTRAAIQDPNPVIVFEHKALYARKGELNGNADANLGRAAVRRAGSDVTIVAALAMVEVAIEAAEQLARRRHRGRGTRPALPATAGRRRDCRIGGAHQARRGGGGRTSAGRLRRGGGGPCRRGRRARGGAQGHDARPAHSVRAVTREGGSPGRGPGGGRRTAPALSR